MTYFQHASMLEVVLGVRDVARSKGSKQKRRKPTVVQDACSVTALLFAFRALDEAGLQFLPQCMLVPFSGVPNVPAEVSWGSIVSAGTAKNWR